MSNQKKTVYVIGTNHFDPIWRRAFKKSFYYNGQKFVGAETVEDACITDWLKMSEHSDLCFEIESVLVLRNYLEHHPETLEQFQKLFKEGRFELLACGEIIPDTNMASGETLVRNLAYGMWWAKDTLGEYPVTGNINDAFGSSAQLPQIFRRCGVKWLTGLSYKFPMGEYWRGLDGTKIKITPNMQYTWLGMAKYLSEGTYYRPCPKCNGEGCPSCRGSGFDQSFKMGAVPDCEGLDLEKNGFGAIYVGGEETLVSEKLPEYVAQANQQQDDVEYRFGLHKDIGKLYFQDLIDNTDTCEESQVAAELEGNPIQTGCYVSRIRTKQEVRRLENRTLTLEKAAASLLNPQGKYPYDLIQKAWRIISFCSFHDNITGTHIDAGYEELLENYAECDRTLDEIQEILCREGFQKQIGAATVFNPHSFEVTDYVTVQDSSGVSRLAKVTVPAGKSVTLRGDDGSQPQWENAENFRTTENEYYRIRFDEHGITSIFDKSLNKELIRDDLGYANELILENDFGDPWSTREEDRKRTQLGRMNQLKSVRKSDAGIEIVYEGKLRGNEKLLDDPLDYRVLLLEWKQTILLRPQEKEIHFATDILWDAFDRRIRISFPTAMVDDDGDYAIPYGTIRRAKYDKEARKAVGVADGDWPTMEWFATSRKRDFNVALINKGTPSCRIERGTMLMSVLRSPTFPSCLFWPRVYYAPVYDGMRDRGRHHFEYALTSFYGEWQESSIYEQARALNMPLCVFQDMVPAGSAPELPAIKAGSTEISAYKAAEDRQGWILRLFETRGQADTAEITLPDGVKEAYLCSLLEENQEALVVNDGKITVPMRPFQIESVRLVK